MEWSQNLDSTILKSFQNGKNSLRFHEHILTYKFYSTDASATLQICEPTKATSDEDENPELQNVNSEEEEDTLPELNKTNEVLKKKKWKLGNAIGEICRVLEKGDEDMEEAIDQLGQLGVQFYPRLVSMSLDKASSPILALRFFQWAKAQPGFKHKSSLYDKLANIHGRCKDFKTLQMILVEMQSAGCSYSAKTFSFATVCHDDPDILNELMEMFEKLALSLRRDGYEMLIAALCEENHINEALTVLEKMASAGCARRMLTYRPLIQVYCQNNQMDKVQDVFEMTKYFPQDPICYNLVLSALCRKEQFEEASRFLQSMVNMGYKPDAITYNILICAACKIGKIEGALQLFDRLKEEGFNPLFGTYSHLLRELFRIRGFDAAHEFLIQQSGKDNKLNIGNYIYLSKVCRKSGKHKEASNLLLEMKAKGFEASR